MTRKKTIKVLGLFMAIVILTSPFWVIGIRKATDWGARVYVSDRLNMKTGEWHEIFDEFDTRFEPGMSRQEVLEILLELNASSEENLRTDDELRNSRGCLAEQRAADSEEYTCADGVDLFQEVLVVRLITNLNYRFDYDQNMRLVQVNRPPSM